MARILDGMSEAYHANMRLRLDRLKVEELTDRDEFWMSKPDELELGRAVEQVLAEDSAYAVVDVQRLNARVAPQSAEYKKFIALEYQMKRDLRTAASFEVSAARACQYKSDHIEEAKRVYVRCDTETRLLATAFPWLPGFLTNHC